MKTLLITLVSLIIFIAPSITLAQTEGVIDYRNFNVQRPEQNIEPPAIIQPTFDWRWLLLPISLIPLLYLIFKNEEDQAEGEYVSSRDYSMRPVFQEIRIKKTKKAKSTKKKALKH